MFNKIRVGARQGKVGTMTNIQRGTYVEWGGKIYKQCLKKLMLDVFVCILLRFIIV